MFFPHAGSVPKQISDYLNFLADRQAAEREPPADRLELEKEREVLRGRLLRILGLDPPPRKTPLNARFVGVPMKLDRCIFHRIVFESLPKSYVAAHLFLPKKIESPAPAMVYVPGHGKRDSYVVHPLTYASNGFIAISLPTLGEEGKKGGGRQCGHKGPYLGDYNWYNTGYNPSGAEVWDNIRAVDYLLTLRDPKTDELLVDREKIGLAGRSGGAARTLWGAAADPRIAAAVASQGFTTIEGYQQALHDTCDAHIFYNYYSLTYTQLYGLIAPRPLLVLHGDQDKLYPRSDELARRMSHIYAVYGAPEKFHYEVFNIGHDDLPKLRMAEYSWLSRWLAKDKAAMTETPVPPALRDKKNLSCFDSWGGRWTRRLRGIGVEAAHIEKLFTQPTPKWEVKTEEDYIFFRKKMFKALREEVLRHAFTHPPARLKKHDKADHGFCRSEKMDLVLEEKLSHGAIFFYKPGSQRKTVVLLADSPVGKMKKSRVKDFLGNGTNLFCLETTGVGSTRLPKKEAPHIIRFAALVGHTLNSMRVNDALAAVRTLSTHEAVDPKKIYLWGKGNLAVPAIYATAVNETVAGLVLEDAPDHHTSETALFLVLRYADIPQSASLVYPRPIYLIGRKAAGFTWTKNLYNLLGAPKKFVDTHRDPRSLLDRSNSPKRYLESML